MAFTEEELKRTTERICEECRITDWAHNLGYTVISKGSTYGLKEIHGCAIYDDTNTYYTFSTGKGGTVINFLEEYGNMSRKEAYKILVDSLGGYDRIMDKPYIPRAKPKPPEKKPFVLPAKDDSNRNVIAYLTKTRKLDEGVVNDLIKRNMIYQDTHKNCVFVGYDKADKAVFACKRSSNTYKKYVGDVSGNDYSVCWHIDNGVKNLVVAESPIDIMSVMTIMQQKGKELSDYNFLALSGVTKLDAVLHHVKESGTQSVIIGFDRDEAGIKAGWELDKRLKAGNFGGEIVRYLPVNKDFNDDLKGCNPGIDLAIKVNEDISDERYCNPFIAESLRKIGVRFGKIIENREHQESWWIPFKAEDNLVKEFEKGNVSVIHPEYSTDEKVKEMVNVFEAIYKVGILPELNQRLDDAKCTPSLKDIKKVALYLDEKKNGIQYKQGNINNAVSKKAAKTR